MAPTLLHITRITTLLILSIIILLALHSQRALSADIEDNEEYRLDNPFADTRLRSRFLASIKKGTNCDSNTNNVCNGVSANYGTSVLHCCKTHCRNVVGDRNNCGGCGHKCALGELCCHGTCTNIANNAAHCGKCDNACSLGLKCEYGSCGYA